MEIIPYIWKKLPNSSIFTKNFNKMTTNVPIFRPGIHHSIEIREKSANGSLICIYVPKTRRYADLCELGFMSDPYTST